MTGARCGCSPRGLPPLGERVARARHAGERDAPRRGGGPVLPLRRLGGAQRGRKRGDPPGERAALVDVALGDEQRSVAPAVVPVERILARVGPAGAERRSARRAHSRARGRSRHTKTTSADGLAPGCGSGACAARTSRRGSGRSARASVAPEPGSPRRSSSSTRRSDRRPHRRIGRGTARLVTSGRSVCEAHRLARGPAGIVRGSRAARAHPAARSSPGRRSPARPRPSEAPVE